MKIYITDIFPSSLKNKLTNFDKYLVNSVTKYELTSEDYGIHYIENDSIYRVEPNFKPDFRVIKDHFDNELLIDNTELATFELSEVLAWSASNANQQNFALVPINFYFIYNDNKIDLSDQFIKEEINVFLSHLN